MKKKAVIFDFDYTLGDSTAGIVLSVNHGLIRLGYEPRDTESIRKTVGLSLKDTFLALVPGGSADEALRFPGYFREKTDQVMVDNTRLYPHVTESLAALRSRGIRTGIVTTKYHYRIQQILARFDALELFDLIVGAEDVRVEKPDPEGLFHAAEALSLGVEDLLYVGDSLVDAKTAKNAGADFAAVLTGTTAAAEFRLYPHMLIGENVPEVLSFLLNEYADV